jgi:hypothetical protein
MGSSLELIRCDGSEFLRDWLATWAQERSKPDGSQCEHASITALAVGKCPRRIGVLVAVATVVVLTTVSRPFSSDAAPAARTSMHLYAPFNGGGIAKGIRIARTVRGYCWTSSLADSRDDAFRCFVGNYIHDPCFENTVMPSSYVLCPLYYPGTKVLRINLTKPLPAHPSVSDPTRYQPWALQLANGRWCEVITGATGLVAGLRINYGCTPPGILVGAPRRTSPTWTIFYASGYTSTAYESVAVRSAWW